MVETNSGSDGSAACAGVRLAAGLALALLAAGAHAGMLYKSIGPDGVVQFSDTPPKDGVIVDQRPTSVVAPLAPWPAAPGSAAFSGASSNPLLALGDGSADDAELALANTKVDLAEHALALARHGLEEDTARIRLDEPTRTRTDDDRIAFYEHDLKLARDNLLGILKSRRAAITVAAAQPGAPIIGPLHRVASR
jgi:hypothetical protein